MCLCYSLHLSVSVCLSMPVCLSVPVCDCAYFVADVAVIYFIFIAFSVCT